MKISQVAPDCALGGKHVGSYEVFVPVAAITRTL